ncbi:unnamed protein product, partial [Prorocentrum cordatum]
RRGRGAARGGGLGRAAARGGGQRRRRRAARPRLRALRDRPGRARRLRGLRPEPRQASLSDRGHRPGPGLRRVHLLLGRPRGRRLRGLVDGAPARRRGRLGPPPRVAGRPLASQESGWCAPHDGPVDAVMVVETVTAAEDLPILPDRQAPSSGSLQRPREATSRTDEARKARLGRLAAQLKPQADGAAEQVRQDSGRQEQLVALKRSLDSVHKETDEQMRRMMELQRKMQSLQQSMQDRQKREEQIQRRMRELVVSSSVIDT